MSSIGLPVPAGLIITTDACKQYYAKGGRVPDGLFNELKGKLGQLESVTGRQLGNRDKPLFLSVRSGAPYSMPGLMDTILNLGLNDETTETLAKKTGNERFSLDTPPFYSDVWKDRARRERTEVRGDYREPQEEAGSQTGRRIESSNPEAHHSGL